MRSELAMLYIIEPVARGGAGAARLPAKYSRPRAGSTMVVS